jgi:hypothetical protein
MRQISKSNCTCGGTVTEVAQTPEEKRTHNCPRGCCGYALECDKCKTRFVIEIESPEPAWD